MSKITQKNIDNLTALWKTVGNSFQQHYPGKAFSYNEIPNSEWPNRIWFNEDLKEETLATIVELMKSASVPLTLSYWSDFEHSLDPLFEQSGLSKKSEQIGMSLKLGQQFDQSNRLNLKRVTETNQANIWAELYPQSFGYKISAETINRTQAEIQYYLVYKDHQATGTVIVHETETLIGIHGLGIVPEFRKQGLAEEVMAYLLNNAIASNKKTATLQSSAMGKNIYKKMGFTEDFLMTNYQLK